MACISMCSSSVTRYSMLEIVGIITIITGITCPGMKQLAWLRIIHFGD